MQRMMMFVLRESPAQYEAFGFAQLKVPSGFLDPVSIYLTPLHLFAASFRCSIHRDLTVDRGQGDRNQGSES